MPHADDVGKLARYGARWSILLTIGRQCIAFGATMVLARLVAPEAFGVFQMCATLTVFLSALSEAGFSTVTVQTRDLTHRQMDNLFWLATALGAALWGVCIAAGPLLVSFYKEPEAQSIAAAVGFGFLVSGVAVQPMALLRRRMHVERQAAAELVAFSVGAVAGIIAAIMRLGVWALVIQALVYQTVRMIAVVLASRYRPSLPTFGSGTLGLLGFGGYLTLYGLTYYFARNLDNILVGRYCGAETLGFYSRAYFLMLLPTMLVTSTLDLVMVPALSAFQGDPERMGAAYRKALRTVAFVGCPLSACLSVVAPEAVHLVYGARWMPVVPILIWLGLAGVLQPLHNTISWLYLATGKGRALFLWGAVATIALASGFVVGLRWGAVGVAASYAIVMAFVLVLPALYFAHRSANLRLWPSLKPIVPILACVLAAVLLAVLAGRIAESGVGIWWFTLLAKILVGGVVYLALAIRFARPLPVEGLEALLVRLGWR